jgi:multiple sugar transport system ATP-binding protein
MANLDGALWARQEGIRIKLPAAIAGRLREHVGEKVTLGIRPEDIHVASGGETADLSFDAEVEVIEKLGSQVLLDVKVGPNMMVAAVEPNITAKVHDRLRLALNPNRLHFFDGVSHAAI